MLLDKFLSVAGASGGPPDAQFNYVTMLLTGDGTNGAQNNTFLDSSSNAFTITRSGNTTQGTFSPYGSLWSVNFVPAAGYGDQLTVGNATDLQFGTGDFTFEAWVNTNGYGNYQTLYDKGYGAAGSFLIQMNTDYKPFVYSSGGFLMTSSTAFVVGTWNHFAVVRSGSTMTMYINGVSVASVSNSTNFNDASNIAVGARYLDKTYPWNGYISNVRIVKGTAVYTGAFTPSTTPLTAISGTSLLICQSNRFIDNSANNYTVAPVTAPSVQRFSPFNPTQTYSTATIGGSGYFDGTGDYLTAPNSSAFDFGSGNFTLEFWVYYNGTFSDPIYKGSNSVYAPFGILLGSNTAYFYTSNNGTGYTVTIGGSGVQVNAWNHIAAVRNGDVYTIYVNGVSAATTTQSGALITNTEAVGIGAANNGASGIAGYLTDVRIVKGTAVYTSNFTPSTSPLTAISGTSLLLSCQNAGIPDSAMMNDLETVGNAQVSTSVKKYGTGSMYFTATTDRLVPAYSTTNCFALGAGDFTVEGWMYMPTISGSNYGNVMSSGASAAQFTLTCGTTGYAGTDNKLNFNAGSDGVLTSTTTVTNSAWHHFAIVRYGSSYKLFIDGTQEATLASSGINFVQWASSTYVGVGAGYHNAQPNTYLDDVRITKGYARYTSNFSVPTSAFPTY